MYTTFKEAWSDLLSEFPQAKLVVKEESKLMKVLAWLMFWNKTFMTTMTTVVGYTIYMPFGIPESYKATVINHERIHMRQLRKYKIFMSLGYLFCLPAVWTLRSKWEYEAYVVTMEHEALARGAVSPSTIDFILKQFTGPAYLFMNPFGTKLRARLEAQKVLIDAMVKDGRLKAESPMDR